MPSKKYPQTGTLIIAVFTPILLILLFRFFKKGISSDLESIVSDVAILLLLTSLLVFYKLTIIIDENSLSFKFGIGWFGKTYPLSEIKSCEPVKNHWLAGFGIRWLGNGWLYNVSGLKAIELRFKNKKTIVRIGTDRPEEICEILRKRIS